METGGAKLAGPESWGGSKPHRHDDVAVAIVPLGPEDTRAHVVC